MSKKTSADVPQIMWICVSEDNHFHYNSLAYTKKNSIRKEVEYAQDTVQEDFEWKDLQNWGFKCVKVKVTIEPVCKD